MDSISGWMHLLIKEISNRDIEMVMVYGSLRIRDKLIKVIIF